MNRVISHHGFLVCLFDILGFETQLNEIGLDGVLEKYKTLIKVVHHSNATYDFFKSVLNIPGSAYWAKDGDIQLIYQLRAAYASDSILVWADRTWPASLNTSKIEIEEKRSHPAIGWVTHPVPCDPFLDLCNELICRSLEIGLPLRGALAIGDAVFDEAQRIFLGKPIIEAARLESGQKWIGVTPCHSFLSQIIPPRYLLKYEAQMKPNYEQLSNGSALDWPRHWRRTRKSSLEQSVNAIKSEAYSIYYDNTIDFIKYSKKYAHLYESDNETRLQTVYPFFSSKELALSLRCLKNEAV